MPTYMPSEAPDVPIAGVDFTPSPTHFDPWPTSSEVVSEPVEVAPTQAPTHFDPWPTSAEVVSEPVEVAPTLAPYPKPTAAPYAEPTAPLVSEPVEVMPSAKPAAKPTTAPAMNTPPTTGPAAQPSAKPVAKPTAKPAAEPVDMQPIVQGPPPSDCYDDDSWYEMTNMEYDCDWVSAMPAARCGSEGANGYFAFE